MNLTHDKKIKRDDGTWVRIEVDYMESRYPRVRPWQVRVATRQTHRHSWKYVNHIDSYEYRGMSPEEQWNEDLAKALEHVTMDEILQTCRELVQSLTPGVPDFTAIPNPPKRNKGY